MKVQEDPHGGGGDWYVTAARAMRRYAEVNRHAWAKLTQIQLELLGAGFETLAREWWLLAGTRAPADFAAAQSELMAEYGVKVTDGVNAALEVLGERQRDVLECAERFGEQTARASAEPVRAAGQTKTRAA